jgi:hypothetical protein
MENAKHVIDELSRVGEVDSALLQQPVQEGFSIEVWLKKLRGGFLLVLGFLLSPLSFWNDLFFNLPIAYGFGYVCSWFNSDLLLPCAIAGYWLSNIVGILLMQVGAVDVFQEQPKEHNLKKQLLAGLVSSTVYSLVILALVQFNILQAPALFPGN